MDVSDEEDNVTSSSHVNHGGGSSSKPGLSRTTSARDSSPSSEYDEPLALAAATAAGGQQQAQAQGGSEAGGSAKGSAGSGARNETDRAAERAAYELQVEGRRKLFRPRAPHGPTRKPRSWDMEQCFTIPHATSVNALAVPPSCSNLYTGGPDGFIRQYNVHATLDRSVYHEATTLMMKTGGHAPASGELKLSVLSGYWENERPGTWMAEELPRQQGQQDKESKLKWGPKMHSYGVQNTPGSSVHSLAVHSEEVWGLGGTSYGTINLFTLRMDRGHVRHVFSSSDDHNTILGHKSKAPVSVLQLTGDETSFLSGGWDSRILHWDLNTGRMTRSYLAHAGDISSIAFRPTSFGGAIPSGGGAAEEGEGPSGRAQQEGGASPAESTSSSTGVAAALVVSSHPPPSAEEKAASTAQQNGPTANGPSSKPEAINVDDDADGEMDVDAEGEEDDDVVVVSDTLPGSAAAPLPTQAAAAPAAAPAVVHQKLADVAAEKRSKVPLCGAPDLPVLSGEVFLSTSSDGEVFIWDRREQNSVRRFESGGKHSRFCSSAVWSADGNSVFVGRQTARIEAYDIRSSATPSESWTLPAASGAVSSLHLLPTGDHLVSASSDSLRLWNLSAPRAAETTMPRFKVIPGHPGGFVSHLYVDPLCRYLVAAQGHRGFDSTSSECVVLYDMQPLW